MVRSIAIVVGRVIKDIIVDLGGTHYCYSHYLFSTIKITLSKLPRLNSIIYMIPPITINRCQAGFQI